MNITEAEKVCTSLRRFTNLTRKATLRADVVCPMMDEYPVGDSRRVVYADGTTRQVPKATKRVVVYENGKPVWRLGVDARIVFRGGKNGDHSIDVSVSDVERVLAHWDGYCEANGLAKPRVGQVVKFFSGSASKLGGYRTGRVVKVGPKRAVIAFKFKHGGESTVTLPFHEIVFGS